MMLRLIERFDRYVGRFLAPIVVALSLVVAIGMVTGIVARSILSEPLLGLEEIILFTVMWLYMLGAALASRDSSHLSADFLSDYMQAGRTRRLVQLTAKLIAMIAVLAFVVWSFDLFHWGFTMEQSTPVIKLPYYLVQSSMFIAAIIMAIYTFRDLLVFLQEEEDAN